MATFGLRFFRCSWRRTMAGITLFRGRQHFCRPHLLASRSTSMANGSQSRYFVHVDDAVQAVLAALARTSTTGQVCNIGTGVETSQGCQNAAPHYETFGCPSLSGSTSR